MTNLHPNGERYLMPTSWNTWRGMPMSHRYTLPASSAKGRGRQRERDHLASTAWPCPLTGGSKLSTGARFWLAHSAAARYQGWSIRNVFSWQSRLLMIRSTGVSGRSVQLDNKTVMADWVASFNNNILQIFNFGKSISFLIVSGWNDPQVLWGQDCSNFTNASEKVPGVATFTSPLLLANLVKVYNPVRTILYSHNI